jgi:DNA-binding GntR family transcriptional regulator
VAARAPETASLARRTCASTVADELRRMILSGELSAGERLRQAEVAERFGVSTTPVREAFTALSRQGLLRHEVHRGAVVFPPSLADVRENLEIRIALEPLATGAAASSISAEKLDALDRTVTQLAACVSGSRDPLEYNRLDRTFHGAIYAAAQRPRLAEIIESLRDAADAYVHLRTLRADDDHVLPRKQAQHEQIARALRARDGETAARLAAEHIGITAEQIEIVLGA